MNATDAQIKARINDGHFAYLREKAGGRPFVEKVRTRAKVARTLADWELVATDGETLVITVRGREILAWGVRDARTGAT